ncbi:MAG TPA: transglutaminase-like domain-containing protein [Tepidisphaeraceae bacterium]|jgi:regulator of sirC expression with transglutaminase-like and TPR domain|nr:transglutaminase-like domain-containing protein [Tepidisphaeraceae bacterium]
MKPASQPLCCSVRAYNLLGGQLANMSSSDALLNGAVAIAMHEMPDADPAAVDLILQNYADRIRGRVRGSQPQALLAHLHEFLFDELGLVGNSEDYYSPANSYLPAVLKTRKGLPITLSLVYKLIAERLGIRCWGVGLPGHFMIGVETDGAPMLVDAFAGGRVLTADEAHSRLQEMFGAEMQWSEELLRPASNRHWLTRILQNLLNVFGAAGRYSDVAAVLEMEMLLWPDQNHLQRDLGLVLARCGLSRPASIWIDRYLQTNPDDPQQSQLRELLQVLGT